MLKSVRAASNSIYVTPNGDPEESIGAAFDVVTGDINSQYNPATQETSVVLTGNTVSSSDLNHLQPNTEYRLAIDDVTEVPAENVSMHWSIAEDGFSRATLSISTSDLNSGPQSHQFTTDGDLSDWVVTVGGQPNTGQFRVLRLRIEKA